MNTLRIPLAVAGQRLGFVTMVAFFVGVTTAADKWLVPADLGPIDDLLRTPPRDISLVVLQITAGSAAGILAIVLSISLLVLNNASTRLGDRLVRFLMDEPVGSYVFDLLASTLIVSLWGLLVVAPRNNPVFTPTLAALLLTLGVLSLLQYRSHALAFLNPDSTTTEIARRLVNSVGQATYRSRGSEVVVYNLQRRSVNWLQNLNDLSGALIRAHDERAVSSLSSVVSSLFSFYLSQRPQIPLSSRWFPPTSVRMEESEGWTFLEQRRIMREVGLGQPTRQTSDTEWVETELWNCLKPILDVAIDQQSERLLSAMTSALGKIAAAAVKWEDAEVLSRALELFGRLSSLVSDANVAGWGGAVQDAHILMAEAHLDALRSLALPSAIDELHWTNEAEIRGLRLGWMRQQALLEMYGKLQIERAYSGHLVSPRMVIRAELEVEFKKVGEWHVKQLDELSAIISEQLKSSLSRKNLTSAGTWNLVQLAIARRSGAKGQREFGFRVATQALSVAAYTYQAVPSQLKGETRDAVEDLLIGAIMGSNEKVIGIALRSAFLVLSKFNDELNQKGKQDYSPMIRMMSLAGYVFLSAEIDQSEMRRSKLREVIELFRDPDAVMESWIELVQPPMTLAIGLIWQTTGRYHDLRLHFQRQMDALPRTWSQGPGIASHEYADHPSRLIQRLSSWHGWDLKQVVESMGEWFRNARGTNAPDGGPIKKEPKKRLPPPDESESSDE